MNSMYVLISSLIVNELTDTVTSYISFLWGYVCADQDLLHMQQ